MNFLGHIFSAVMIPILMVTSFLFGNHKTSQPPTAPIVQEVSTSQITTPSQTAPVTQKQDQSQKTKSKKTTQTDSVSTTVHTSEPTTPPIPTPPPNTTLCNGIYYTACLADQDFVCPASGNAYCQLPPQQNPNLQTTAQQQAQAAAQAKQNKINTLTTEYNSQLLSLNQQIIDIKNQYYIDLAANNSAPIPLEFIQSRAEKLLTDANAKIAQIQLQEQQLYITYQSQLNAL